MKTPSFKSFHRPQLMGARHESRVHLSLNSRLHQFVTEHLKASGHAVFPQSSPHGAYISMEAVRWMEANRETLAEDVAAQMAAARAAARVERAARKAAEDAAAAAESARREAIGPDGWQWEIDLYHLTRLYSETSAQIQVQGLQERAYKPSKLARHRALIASKIAKVDAACEKLPLIASEIHCHLIAQPHELCRLPQFCGRTISILREPDICDLASRIVANAQTRLTDARAYAFPESTATHPAL